MTVVGTLPSLLLLQTGRGAAAPWLIPRGASKRPPYGCYGAARKLRGNCQVEHGQVEYLAAQTVLFGKRKGGYKVQF